ncbi:MAG: hypothetical protein ACPIOQ_54750 [Promethearchaeia archaeon]
MLSQSYFSSGTARRAAGTRTDRRPSFFCAELSMGGSGSAGLQHIPQDNLSLVQLEEVQTTVNK